LQQKIGRADVRRDFDVPLYRGDVVGTGYDTEQKAHAAAAVASRLQGRAMAVLVDQDGFTVARVKSLPMGAREEFDYSFGIHRERGLKLFSSVVELVDARHDALPQSHIEDDLFLDRSTKSSVVLGSADPYHKRALISVLRNENGYYRWSRSERQQAIQDLQNYPGDLTSSQHMRLRAIFTKGEEGGRYSDFRRALYDKTPPVPPPGGPSNAQQRLMGLIRNVDNGWLPEDKQRALGALAAATRDIPRDTEMRLKDLYETGQAVAEFLRVLADSQGSLRKSFHLR